MMMKLVSHSSARLNADTGFNANRRPAPRGPSASTSVDDDVARVESSRLRLANLVVGLIHLAQAIALFVLSNDFTLPLTAAFSAGPPGSDFTEREVLWNVPIGPLVGVFLLLAAIDHLLMAAPGVWPWYRDKLARQINPARWWEYSISASIMIVLIALVTGVSDVGAVVAIFGVNAAMILFGLVMEEVNRPNAPVRWSPFVFGCVAGAVPWIVIAIQVVGAEVRAGGGGIPTFVYGIIVSLFLLFNSFAVNMLLQYRQVGRWRDYLFGEKAYIVLSLTAKTALAWQIFANTLIE
jgi:hypothetical protein